jgi:DNA anti-recombination protein RmuC
MTGEEMERAIDFLLKSQANLEARIEQVNTSLAVQIADLAEKVTALTGVVNIQAESQGRFNQTVTTAITSLAEAQQKTEAKVDRLTDVVGKLVEQLAGGSA